MIHTSEAIFAVSDVRETVRFYREKLGFESEWFWQDPPTFGGVRWAHAQVMFCFMPHMHGKIEGLMHMFRVEDIQSLYAKHKAAGAPIIAELANKPWGMSEYVVRDPNGYHLRFGGAEIYHPKATATDAMPTYVRIEKRTPTIEQYMRLTESVGWIGNIENMSDALERAIFCIMAIDSRDDQPIGMARIGGDRRGYMIFDVIVTPPHQSQKIGSAIMEAALAELRKIGPKGAFVGLFTGKPHFYERLGFVKDIGMHLAL
jgi:GNAT superfamily N-acetyltransferase/uncharacterized glyoxalase superfamily protein PhnB